MLSTIIVGAGAIAYAHAEALTKLGVTIRGVYDINPASAHKLAAQYGTVAVEDFAEIVKSVDMVHLCTPPAKRVEHAAVAMTAGCHVLAEKPLAISIADAQTIVDLAQQHQVKLMVDYNHRFRVGFQQLLSIVQSGRIGEVVDVFIYRMSMLGGNAGTQNDTWRRTPNLVCGMTIESLSHDIDMVLQLAGPIRDVKADIRGTFADVPQFDTNAHVSFNLGRGGMALIHSSWSSHLKGSVRGVMGTKGTVILEGDDLFDFTRLRLKTNEMPCEEVLQVNDTYNLHTCPSYYNVNKHCIECIANKTESTISGAYALGTLKISHAILESAKTQRVVTL